MASGYLAAPFNYAPTYEVGATPGDISVGATLRRPKNKKDPQEEKTPTRVPNEGNGNGEANGAQSGSAGAGISAGAGAAGAVAQPGSAARSMMAAQENEPASSTNLSQSQFNTLIHPNPISAPASPTKTTVAPAASSPGFWSQVGHGIASGFDTVRHDTAATADSINAMGRNPSSNLNKVLNFGNPFSSTSAGSSQSSVVEPSNVYSPMRNFPEVSSGSPKVVQGSVVGEGSNAVGSAGQRALPSSIYESPYKASLGRQFMGSGNGSAVDTSTPWYDSIPNDLSSIGEDVLAGL